MENTIQVTAFHHWLMKATDGDEKRIAHFLRGEVIFERNPQAFELLEATGDITYTNDTFEKAARLVKQITAQE